MRSLRMTSSRVRRALLALIVGTVFLLAALIALWHASTQCQVSATSGFLHSSHGELVDASGCQVHLTGVNWFGLETSAFAPHGLENRNWQDMLDQIEQAGFNPIRLPFSNQLFNPSRKPQRINYMLHPDRNGLEGLALMDRLIHRAPTHDLNIILYRHHPT